MINKPSSATPSWIVALVIAVALGACTHEKMNSTAPTNSVDEPQAALALAGSVPAAGVVEEGTSVPGVDLGFTRAQVLAAYGPPYSCQGPTQSFCTYEVEGGGRVFVNYGGSGGGEATGGSDDVAFNVHWTEAVSGWVTTAGVNTEMARQDPEGVIAAYPEAQVNYTQYGTLYSVVDHAGGIEIIWESDFYSGQTHVRMAIFNPRTPPVVEKLTRVESLELSLTKSKGSKRVVAFALVRKQNGAAAKNAIVTGRWTLPDGSSQAVSDETSSSGYASFAIEKARRGEYVFVVEDVLLDGYTFDRENSVLTETLQVK